MDQIIANLYISGLLPASNISTVRSKNISHVVTLTENNLPLSVRKSYQEHGISQTHIPKRDHPNEDLLSIFGDLCDLIAAYLSQSKAILIHCGDVRSRSGAVIVAYMMRVRMMDTVEALKFVQGKHPSVQLNLGFYNQLMVWEECEYDIFEEVDGHRKVKGAYVEWKAEPCQKQEWDGKGKGKAVEV